jgi:hypothetical protein
MPAAYSKPCSRDDLRRKLEKREPIKKFSDIKVGDHLIKKKSIYGMQLGYHHGLCIKLESDGRPTIIHYHDSSSNTIGELLGSGCCGGKNASVKEITLPHQDFVESESELQKKGAEVERIVWPDELKRYSDQEVIQRARLGNTIRYCNCESFVMWCKYDRNISVQSPTRLVRIMKWIVDFIKFILDRVVSMAKKTTMKSDLQTAGIEKFSLLGCIFGLAFPLLLDVAYLVGGILEALQKRKDKELTEEEYFEKVAHLVITTVFGAAGKAAGFFIGTSIPIPLSAIFGVLGGAGLGILLGESFSWLFSKYIASVLEKRYSSEHPDLGVKKVYAEACATKVHVCITENSINTI